MATHKVIVLWSVPRSLSTAFERMVRERGDVEVFCEPCAMTYYRSDERVSGRYADEPADPAWRFGAVRDSVSAAAGRGPVFVKEMAYAAEPWLDDDLLACVTNTFMVRDPAKAIASLAREWPDFADEETGFPAAGRVFDRVTDLTGDRPHVVEAERLRRDPAGTVAAWCAAVGLEFLPGALSWEPRRFPAWDRWPGWFESVAASRGFRPPDGDPRPAGADSDDGDDDRPDDGDNDRPDDGGDAVRRRVAEAVAAARPHYLRMTGRDEDGPIRPAAD